MDRRRIGINTLFFIPGEVGGTEIFLRHLVIELSKFRRDLDYYIFTNKENSAVFDNLPNNFIVVKCALNARNRLIRVFWEQFILPLQCLYYKIDVLHSPGYTAPLICQCKKITTIFDLNYHFFPEDFKPIQLVVYKVLIPLVARTSDKIIVHSYNTKKEIVNVLKINPNKIIVIYPGVDEVFYKKLPLKEIDKFISKYKISRPYIMSNAVSHPHKNLSSLIRAYAKLVKESGVTQDLVLLGFAGRAHGELLRLIKELRLGKKIIFTGWVDPQHVSIFYQGADVFVFPSLYEGFGLPVIEAMASEVPVVASDYSCIPEVVGKGGILVESKNPDKISNAILKILGNPRVRADLIKRGKKRARRFSWEKFARSTYQSYF